MQVLWINGSPHPQGCTYTALREVERVLQEEHIDTKLFWIGNEAIHGCIGCHRCEKIKRCVFDDMVTFPKQEKQIYTNFIRFNGFGRHTRRNNGYFIYKWQS